MFQCYLATTPTTTTKTTTTIKTIKATTMMARVTTKTL